MGRVILLKDAPRLIKPYTATLTSGSFDLFHVGHLKFLKQCGRVGRPLIVTVHTDKRITAKKGKGRPIIDGKSRATIVSSIDCVDFVILLDDVSTNKRYPGILKPKTIVFPRDYLKQSYWVRENFPNIKVRFIGRSPGTSTTKIIRKIKM